MKVLNKYRLIVIAVIGIYIASNINWGDGKWKEIVIWDGSGYYAYLPALFVYHDLSFKFYGIVEPKYHHPYNFYEYRVQAGDGIIDKYFIGTSILQMPFFLMGHALALLSGGLNDGYSFYYMIFVSLAAIFYEVVGLYFIMKTLRKYGLDENLITIVLIVIAFATHLFVYSLLQPSISHVYSFAAVSCFIYLIKSLVDSGELRYLLWAAFVAGIIFLIRPVNILILLFIPFLSGSREKFTKLIKRIFSSGKTFFACIVIFLPTISIQFIVYYVQCGMFFPDSYPVEHFQWTHPEMVNILFSYKKGLFIYTPVTFLSLAGLYYAFRKSSFAFFSFVLFFLAITYVFSCWWSWWYGGSFSSRPYTEFLGIFAILLGILLSEIKIRLLKNSVVILLGLLLIVCQIQIYQFRYAIIHWDKMDKKHYWRVFMRVDQIIKNQNPNSDLMMEPEKK